MRTVSLPGCLALLAVVSGVLFSSAAHAQAGRDQRLGPAEIAISTPRAVRDGSNWTIRIVSSPTGNVTQYRASEDPSFAGILWRPYATSVPFEVSEGVGDKTIYFQVRGEPTSALSTLPDPDNRVRDRRPPGDDVPNVLPDLITLPVQEVPYRISRITIASIGASYAAGEGAPDGLGTTPQEAVWDEPQCHRSRRNGRALAVNALRSANAGRLQFEFIDVACSGATINVGVLGPYAGVNHGGEIRPALPSQIEQIEKRLAELGNPPLDVLLLSIGGNDVGFSTIISTLITPAIEEPQVVFGNLRDAWLEHIIENGDTENATRLIGFDLLPDAYDRLAAAIETRLAPRYVLFTEFPDPSRGGDGRFCGCRATVDRGVPRVAGCFGRGFVVNFEELTISGAVPKSYGEIENQSLVTLDGWGVGASAANLWASEAQWVFENVVIRLNDEARGAAQRHGWTMIPGMMIRTMNHGVCAPLGIRWFNNLQDAFARQGDVRGAMHPNQKGQQAYRDAIVPALSATLGLPAPSLPAITSLPFN